MEMPLLTLDDLAFHVLKLFVHSIVLQDWHACIRAILHEKHCLVKEKHHGPREDLRDSKDLAANGVILKQAAAGRI
jgi:hypothetical protein